VPFSRKTPAVTWESQLLRNWLLIHTRLVHRRVCLCTRAWARLGHRNINNVLLNGTIDFDLLVKRLTGDGSWSEYHLIYCKKLMSGSPIPPSPSPSPKSLTCNYCDSCVNGVTVPKQVDPGCPPVNISCASSACPPPSSGSSVMSWICFICSLICCMILFLKAASAAPGASGSGSGFVSGFVAGDILTHLFG